MLLHEVVHAQRTLRVLLVIPAADGHHRRFHAREVLPDAARLPELVVSGVVDVLQPERLLVLEVFLVGVGQRSEIQVELVAVRRAGVERRHHRRPFRTALARPEALVETEAMGQHERAVVIGVVAQVVIGHRRLRGHRHQRRMRVDHARRGEEARLRDAPHADLRHGARNVLEQPFDRVVGVGTLVHVLRAVLHRLVGREDREVALAHEAAANVGVHEDELLAGEQFRRPERVAVLIRAVGLYVVRRTAHHHRIGLAVGKDVFGNIDRRE